MEIAIPYGSSHQILQLDKNVGPVQKLAPRKIKALPDPLGAIKKCLRRPHTGPPLKEILRQGGTVSIIINDVTRKAHSHLFLPLIIEECTSAGIKEKDINIIVANGAHRPHRPEELQALVGKYVFKRIKICDHNCQDKDNQVLVGETSLGNQIFLNKIAVESDHVILTGSINYHYCAGYSGGRKSVLPGISGYSSIVYNHRLMLKPGSETGNLKDNLMHLDMVEAAAMLKPAFMLNEILNDEGNIVGLVAGHFVESHLQGCRLVDAIFGVEFPEQADMVIASCGGYPKDINLYQAHKALENAVKACRPGGVIILLAECADGIGSRELEEEARQKTPLPELQIRVQEQFKLGVHKAYHLARLTQGWKTVLISNIDPSIATGLGFRTAPSFAAALKIALTESAPKKTIVMPYASITLPRMKQVD